MSKRQQFQQAYRAARVGVSPNNGTPDVNRAAAQALEDRTSTGPRLPVVQRLRMWREIEKGIA